MSSTFTDIGIYKVLLVGLLMAGQQAFLARAQTYVLAEESWMQIEGTSTVNEFTCSTTSVTGSGTLNVARGDTVTASDKPGSRAGEARHEDASVLIQLPAGDLDCGHLAMNRDLHEALKADRFPRIRFTLSRTEVLVGPDVNEGNYLIRAYGQLSLAGVERDIRVLVDGEQLDDGRIRGWGLKDLLMTDFGIEPPRALFGLVRAHNEITVRFELVAERKRGTW